MTPLMHIQSHMTTQTPKLVSPFDSALYDALQPPCCHSIPVTFLTHSHFSDVETCFQRGQSSHHVAQWLDLNSERPGSKVRSFTSISSLPHCIWLWTAEFGLNPGRRGSHTQVPSPVTLLFFFFLETGSLTLSGTH